MIEKINNSNYKSIRNAEIDLKKINIGDEVESIGRLAFHRCT